MLLCLCSNSAHWAPVGWVHYGCCKEALQLTSYSFSGLRIVGPIRIYIGEASYHYASFLQIKSQSCQTASTLVPLERYDSVVNKTDPLVSATYIKLHGASPLGVGGSITIKTPQSVLIQSPGLTLGRTILTKPFISSAPRISKLVSSSMWSVAL